MYGPKVYNMPPPQVMESEVYQNQNTKFQNLMDHTIIPNVRLGIY